jgi:hypothetical protein
MLLVLMLVRVLVLAPSKALPLEIFDNNIFLSGS